MSSVSTAFKVHYNQKLGDPSGHLGGNAPWPLGGGRGIDALGSWEILLHDYSIAVATVPSRRNPRNLLSSSIKDHTHHNLSRSD